jgi:hypothetical protein
MSKPKAFQIKVRCDDELFLRMKANADHKDISLSQEIRERLQLSIQMDIYGEPGWRTQLEISRLKHELAEARAGLAPS